MKQDRLSQRPRPTPHWQLRDSAALLTLAILGLAFSFEMVTMHGVPVARDIQGFFIPHRHILWQALQDLTIPLWSPLIGTGAPVLANFQSGVFYPPHWLYGVMSFLTAFNWLIVLHLLLGGAGMYVLCRHIRFSRAASWIAAVSFMLGGYLVSLTNLINALQAASWMPLMILALLRSVRTPRPLTVCILVGVYLLAFLGGAPYTFLIAAAVSGGYVLLWATDHTDVPWWRVVVTLTLAAIAVAGLSAAQLLPTLRLVAESTRSSGLSLHEAATYSTDPLRLLHVIFPNDFSDPSYNFGHKLQITSRPPWLYSIYVGVVPLGLALFSGLETERRKEILFWSALVAIGLVLTLGRHTPIFGLAHEHVPGFASFRFPEKFFLLVGFSVPMLAAHGFSALQGRSVDRSWSAVVAGVAGALLLGATVAWSIDENAAKFVVSSLFSGRPAAENLDFVYRTWKDALYRLSTLFVSLLLLIGLYRQRLLRNGIFLSLVPLLVAGDLWLAHRHLIPTVDPSFYTEPPELARVLPMDELRTHYRYAATPFDRSSAGGFSGRHLSISAIKWLNQQTIHSSTGALYGILTLNSADAIHVRHAERRRSLLRSMDERSIWRLLELHSVTSVYSLRDHDEGFHSGRTALDSLPGYVYEVDAPLPRASLGRATVLPADSSVLKEILLSQGSVKRPVVLSGDSTGRALAELLSWATGKPEYRLDRAIGVEASTAVYDDGGGTAVIARDTGETIEVRIDPVTSSFVLLTDTHYPGWTAYVDGERRPLLRANYFFRAVPVLPGDHEVVFRYESAPLEAGLWTSGISLVVLLGALGLWWQVGSESEA